jgi:hypothetical protein
LRYDNVRVAKDSACGPFAGPRDAVVEGLPVDQEDVTSAGRGWWAGDWFAFGSKVIERYQL